MSNRPKLVICSYTLLLYVFSSTVGTHRDFQATHKINKGTGKRFPDLTAGLLIVSCVAGTGNTLLIPGIKTALCIHRGYYYYCSYLHRSNSGRLRLPPPAVVCFCVPCPPSPLTASAVQHRVCEDAQDGLYHPGLPSVSVWTEARQEGKHAC